MLGILAVVAFILAFLFHGTGFHASAWLDWESLMLAGFVLLALAALGVGPAISFRRSPPQAPPQ